MGLRYLKGIYNQQQVLSTRPRGFEFPVGLNITSPLSSGNSANSGTTQTYDLLMSGGGGGGGFGNGYPESAFRGGGGGGAGGIRIVSGNNWTDFTEFKNPTSIDQTTNFIPVVIGSGGGNHSPGSLTCIGTTNCVGGGGFGGQGQNPGGSGASGGGAGGACGAASQGGTGILGQGCNGGTQGGNPSNSPVGGSNGGSACANASTSGITSTITGTAVAYSSGGAYTGGNPGTNATANRGNGGGGGGNPGYGPHQGGNGGSGIVAIRYRNPAAPTTPLATGGTICCTGDCIIHVFTSSGFLNVATTFAIN